MKCPGISVVIPTYNNGPEINRAILSILNQDALLAGRCTVEIIIVNDGSDPGFMPALLELPATYPESILIHQEKQSGPAAARNRGIKQASGDFISFLDADDEWPVSKLSLLLPFFDDSHIEVAGGKIKYLLEEGLAPLRMKYEDEENRLTHVHLGATLVRKSVFDKKYFFFNEDLRFSEDVDWWFRLRENNIGIIICDETTLLYHVHGQNMSYEKNIDELKILNILHLSLSRRKNMNTEQKIPQLKDFLVRKDDPLISVVLPLYNGKHLIKNTIDHVIAQTYKNWELIVVDDGSTDGGSDFVRASYPGVTVLRKDNAGVAAARNTGITAANGEFIAFLDQDDEWLPEKLRRQLDLLISDPYCAFVTCNQHFVCQEGVTMPSNFSLKLLEEHRGFVPSALLVRRHALATVKNFDESLIVSSDMELIRQLRGAGFKENNVDELLLKKWFHGENASTETKLMRTEILALLHRQIKRK